MKTVGEGSVTATAGGTGPAGRTQPLDWLQTATARTARGSNITRVEQGKKL